MLYMAGGRDRYRHDCQSSPMVHTMDSWVAYWTGAFETGKQKEEDATNRLDTQRTAKLYVFNEIYPDEA